MSEEKIQFIEISPEDLKNQFAAEVKSQLADFFKNHNPSVQNEYLTRKETAAFLKCDLSTLWAWTKAGKISSYGISNRVYYRKKDVEAALIPLNSNSLK